MKYSGYHPQTQGKDERFHRSLKAELMQGPPWASLAQAQAAFDHWRGIYNRQRPHQALGMQVPVQRYRPSVRTCCEHPAAPEYDSAEVVRQVQDQGRISWRGRNWRVGKAFIGEQVALRPQACNDGCYDVLWGTLRIARIDLNDQSVIAGRIID